MVLYSMLGILTATLPVAAHAESLPPVLQKPFKLNPETGCFSYTGKAVEFTGQFRAGRLCRHPHGNAGR